MLYSKKLHFSFKLSKGILMAEIFVYIFTGQLSFCKSWSFASTELYLNSNLAETIVCILLYYSLTEACLVTVFYLKFEPS